MCNQRSPCICLGIRAASRMPDSFSSLRQLSYIINNFIVIISTLKRLVSQPDTWICVSLSLHVLYTLFSLLFQETSLYL